MSYRHFTGAAVVVALVSGSFVAAGAASAQSVVGSESRAARSVLAQGQPTVRVLSNKALVRAAKAAVRAAKRMGGQRVTVVIMERSGDIRLVIKTRNAGPQTYESAKRKAYTAVSFGQATSRLAGNAAIRQIPGTLTLPGGVPVFRKGFPIAGIGVGGAPDGRIDESIAAAVREALPG